MPVKKYKETTYSHADLVADGTFDIRSKIDGLSIISNEPIQEREIFKKHFRSDFMTVFLLTKGELKLKINLKDYTVGKNNLIAIAPNAVKRLVKVSDNSMATIVSFTPGFLGKLGMPQNMSELFEYFTTKYTPFWKLNQKDAGLVLSLIKQLDKRCNDLEKYPFGKELLYHSFYTFLYEMRALSLKYAVQENTTMSRKETLVMNFTALVQQQFKSERNVQQYARQLFISPKYLTETVKEITGKNAGEIIDDYVVMEAKLLLDEPSLNISAIADRLHFSDQSFFSKFFKRHTGLSPKIYRSIHL